MKLLFIDFTIQHLFDDADYPVGGWAVELRAWLQGFRRIGVRTAILAKQDASDVAESAKETRLLRVYTSRGRVPGLSYLTCFLPRLFIKAWGFRPDVVVQAVAGVNTGLMYLVSRVLRRPFVYRCANDIDVDERYRARLGKSSAAYAFGFTRADAYVAQNSYQFEAIRRRFPTKPAVKLHNPYQSRVDVSYVARSERSYVAWLGVFQRQKNLPLLATLAEALPDISFRIGGKMEVGGDDLQTSEALERLRKLPNVALLGYLRRTEVPDFLDHALLLLSTSHYEGFSNTFLEAWGAGTPIVAPAHVDPDGLIAANRLGKSIADDADFAAAIRWVVGLSDSDYAALSAHCRNYVETEHDPTLLAHKFVTFLNEQVLA